MARVREQDIEAPSKSSAASSTRRACKPKQAGEAKARLLANVSHEIRTPLNAVIGLSGLLLESSLGDEHKDAAATIRGSGKLLLSLINDLLDVSRLDADRIDLEARSFYLAELIDSSFVFIAEAAAGKGLELRRELGDALPPAFIGDPLRIQQVLVNLLSNAVKFTHTGSIRLRVDGRREQDDEHWALHIRVEDSGIGIPADRLEDLFEAFTQADVSTTRRYGGTGLGLTICKGLVERMGGRIWAESRVGQGSTFHVELRLAVSDGSHSLDSEDSSEHAFDTELGMRHPLQILVAEDNRVNQRVIRLLLRRMGYDADLASNGREAVAAVRGPNATTWC